MTDTFSYSPFGELKSRTGTTPTPFQYIGTRGYYTDPSSRVYVRARTYQPNYARWMSVDPLWPGESAYGYARGNPVLFIDKSGLKIPVKPIYGKYCGPQNVYPPGWPKKPVRGDDALDNCCLDHDKCYYERGCNAFNRIWLLKCRECDQKLCECAFGVSCGGIIKKPWCEIVRLGILLIFCYPSLMLDWSLIDPKKYLPNLRRYFPDPYCPPEIPKFPRFPLPPGWPKDIRL
jgi:RHS repeat-associated protein